ncbi:MAG TPA: SPOR domain-containing protein [Candidatus Caenarcaniphilales bacterium]
MTQQRSHEPPFLHPVLQAALSSLDVDLELELAQYRGHLAVSDRGSLTHQVKQNQFLAETPVTSDKLTVAKNSETAADLAFHHPTSDCQAVSLTAVDEDESLLALSTSPLTPESYLESSEALLKNLKNSPEANMPRRFNTLSTLLTSWAITSMGLLLCGFVFSYLFLNSSIISRLNVFTSQTPRSSTASTAIDPHPDTTLTSTPISPDLSSEEFRDLNLASLSGLKPNRDKAAQGSSTPSPFMTPGTSSGNSRPEMMKSQGTTPPLLVPSHPVTQEPPTHSLPPAPATTKARASTSKSRYYYVVINETDKQAFAQARKVVQDAYIRTFPEGARVQVGAFDDIKPAQKLVERLKRQGIIARIRQP